MIIKDVQISYRKKRVTILTKNGELFLPFHKLRVPPATDNKAVDIFVDKELAKRAISYVLEDGRGDSVHLDAFLEFNHDPEYDKSIHLHKLTVKANEAFHKSALSKTDIAQRLETSRSQLDRILDTSNYKKSIDEVLKLLNVLGFKLEIKVRKKAS